MTHSAFCVQNVSDTIITQIVVAWLCKLANHPFRQPLTCWNTGSCKNRYSHPNQHCLCLLISAFQFVKDRCVAFYRLVPALLRKSKNTISSTDLLISPVFQYALICKVRLRLVVALLLCCFFDSWFPSSLADDGGGKRDRTDDPLLAKQVLYQLSYAPIRVKVMVGLGGLEPSTPRLSSVCSNQLSYKPMRSSYFLRISISVYR